MLFILTLYVELIDTPHILKFEANTVRFGRARHVGLDRPDPPKIAPKGPIQPNLPPSVHHFSCSSHLRPPPFLISSPPGHIQRYRCRHRIPHRPAPPRMMPPCCMWAFRRSMGPLKEAVWVESDRDRWWCGPREGSIWSTVTTRPNPINPIVIHPAIGKEGAISPTSGSLI